MREIFKKILLIQIILLLFFPTASVLALEAPDPPSLPTTPVLETETPPTPSPPETPTTPSPETIEPTLEPTAPTETEILSSNDSGTNDDLDTLDQLPQGDQQNSQSQQTDSNQSGPSANGNVGDTDLETGDGLTTGILTTEINNNTTLQGSDVPIENNTGIENTGNGSDSTNSASSTNESSATVVQDNTAVIENNLEFDTNTGESSASQNVGTSTITTGNANTSGTLVTMANTNLVGLAVSEFNVANDTEGDLLLDFAANCISGCDIFNPTLLANTGNGNNSENNATLEQVIDNDTFQNNDATLENNVMMTANSGYNQADQNTGGDSAIETGDASISANVISFLNNNIAGNVILGLVNIFGDLIGDIILPEEALNIPLANAANTGNGSESTNLTLIDSQINNTTFQTNDALIQNNLDFEANTGANQTNKNTGGNSTIETGDANVESQTLNIANSNINGGNWWLVLVNEAGEWVGKILGSEDESNLAGSQGTEFAVNPNGDVTVTNQGNGAGSSNSTSLTQTNNTNTVQNNVAQIINNLNLFANTGGNSVSKNTGGNSSIKTGNANIVANLVNFVNNNIVGNGRLTITIVNVFGSWLGDFVTPGNQKEADQLNTEQTKEKIITANTSVDSSQQAQQGSQSSISSLTTIQSQPTPAPVTTIPTANQSVNENQETYVAGAIFDNSNHTPITSFTNKSPENRKVLKLNLAWLLLLLPFGGIGAAIKLRKIPTL